MSLKDAPLTGRKLVRLTVLFAVGTFVLGVPLHMLVDDSLSRAVLVAG